MLKVKIFFVSAIVLIAAVSTYAGNDLESQLKDYFNKTAQKVRHTPNPAEKRTILNESFDRLLKAFNSVSESGTYGNGLKHLDLKEWQLVRYIK